MRALSRITVVRPATPRQGLDQIRPGRLAGTVSWSSDRQVIDRVTETQGANQVADPSVGRAVRLFEFLGRTQQLRNLPPRTVDGYRSVLWLDELPDHPAVTAAHRGEPGPDDPILTIDRVARVAPPEPEFGVDRFDDPDELAPPPRGPGAARPVRRVAAGLAGVGRGANAATGRCGPGTASCSPPTSRPPATPRSWSWWWASAASPGARPAIPRCAGTWSPPRSTITLDDDTGRLAVRRVESVDAADVELDMLDPGLIPNPRHVNDIRAQARELAGHPLDRAETGALVRRVVHTLDAGGEYRDADAVPAPAAHAVAAFAPAVILRRRSQQGLVEIFSTIVDQLTGSGEVPDGLRPLVDADHRPAPRAAAPVEGALVPVDDDEFLPLPVNDTQLRIIRQVDTQAQTLVQGPPGTGKTHTAAALLSHLLAQGKRVLVTAHTDRALREVRDKLPAAIKPLSVAVVGTSREDMSDLKVAVERIAAAATEHDEAASAQTVQACLDAIERLRTRRAELHAQLVAAREDEVREHSHAGYDGTLAAIARALEARRGRFGWLTEHADVHADEPPPITGAELAQWRELLLDRTLAADELEAGGRLVDLTTVPPPPGFADLVAAERAAATADQEHDPEKGHLAFDAVRRIDGTAREQLRRRLRELADEADDLARRRETWMNDALADVRSGRGRAWHGRAQQLGALTGQAEQLAGRLGPLTTVEVDGNATALVPAAQELLRAPGRRRAEDRAGRHAEDRRADPATGQAGAGAVRAGAGGRATAGQRRAGRRVPGVGRADQGARRAGPDVAGRGRGRRRIGARAGPVAQHGTGPAAPGAAAVGGAGERAAAAHRGRAATSGLDGPGRRAGLRPARGRRRRGGRARGRDRAAAPDRGNAVGRRRARGRGAVRARPARGGAAAGPGLLRGGAQAAGAAARGAAADQPARRAGGTGAAAAAVGRRGHRRRAHLGRPARVVRRGVVVGGGRRVGAGPGRDGRQRGAGRDRADRGADPRARSRRWPRRGRGGTRCRRTG